MTSKGGERLTHLAEPETGQHAQLGPGRDAASSFHRREAFSAAPLLPEALATNLLLTTWSRDVETCPLPIDPIFIAGQLGIEVFNSPLNEDVSGMIVKRPSADPAIYLNEADSWNRRRFSCAHELGHYVMRVQESPAPSAEDWGYIDLRSSATALGNHPDEVFANQFAAALLMPAERVEILLPLGAPAMAVEFGVSADAMGFRLRNLGLVT